MTSTEKDGKLYDLLLPDLSGKTQKVLDKAKAELTSKKNSIFLSDDTGGTTHIAIDINIFKKWFGASF